MDGKREKLTGGYCVYCGRPLTAMDSFFATCWELCRNCVPRMHESVDELCQWGRFKEEVRKLRGEEGTDSMKTPLRLVYSSTMVRKDGL